MKPGKEYGTGRIFPRGAWWYCAYFIGGKEHRESTGIAVAENNSEQKANAIRKQKIREVGAQKLGLATVITAKARRIAVGELLDSLQADFELRGKASQQNLSNLKRAKEDFGELPALALTPEAVDGYIKERRADGDADATTNRRLQLVGQAFKLAVARKRLTSVPLIRHLSEVGNARQGFFSETEFRAVHQNLPAHLADFVLFLYLTGWRVGETRSLTWEDVDVDEIRLRAENAKNRSARSIPLVGELAELLTRRRAARVLKTADAVQLARLVFHHDDEPIGDFRKSWRTACGLAGVAGKIPHDFRRTAVRNMVRAGVPTDVARSISGHKTAAVFSRYNIVAPGQQREALERTQAYLAEEQEKAIATIN